jgi:hypothetical protein
LYVSSWGSQLSVLAKVTTDSDGRYSYTWSPSSVGTVSIRASWSGDADYTGVDSGVSTLIVVPLEWLIMGIVIIVLLIVLLVVTMATRRKPLEETEFLVDEEFFEEY